jgi:predicted RNA binding protein YcfA (HicA-like mRNA interferase family)
VGKKEKLIRRILSIPLDFTYQELTSLLSHLGYSEANTGKTSGSRIRFIKPDTAPIILHKPHPGNEMKQYMIRSVIKNLKEKGEI